MASPNSIVTLLTDFGTRDGYVGAMKGAVLTRNPHARLVDVTHDVAPQNVVAAARTLALSAPYFPPGTVHLAVVDPGVGTARAAIAVEAGGHLFVAPDNGLLTDVVDRLGLTAAYEVDASPFGAALSATFHGRDLFGPVAGLLSAGTRPDSLGQPLPRLEALPRGTGPRVTDGGIEGVVIATDHFGNLITNVRIGHLEASRGPLAVRIASHDARFVTTYAEAPSGALVALVGSAGEVEVAVVNGSAAERLAAGVGEAVHLRFEDDT